MPDITNNTEYARYQQTVAQFIADEGLSFLSTGCSPNIDSDEYEHECEPWFSWRPCAMCKCALGGMREYLFARTSNGERSEEWTNPVVRFVICEDCVYYTEYGRLDDMTMARIDAEKTHSQTIDK